MATAAAMQSEAVRANVLRIYENFYWIHEWIIDVCARWILKRDDVEEKLDLVQQAWEERNQMLVFKQEILELGYAWDELDHDSYLFKAVTDRYRLFRTTDDELEVLIGMNLFSEGVFGYTELVELHRQSPELFPKFQGFAVEEQGHFEEGLKVLMRILGEHPELQPHARQLAEKYQQALIETATDAEFAPFLGSLMEQDLVATNIVATALDRFNEVFGFLLEKPAAYRD